MVLITWWRIRLRRTSISITVTITMTTLCLATINRFTYNCITIICCLLFWSIRYTIVYVIQQNFFSRRHTTFFLTIEIIIRECKIYQFRQTTHTFWNKTCKLVICNSQSFNFLKSLKCPWQHTNKDILTYIKHSYLFKLSNFRG